jgi:hypothetical protein
LITTELRDGVSATLAQVTNHPDRDQLAKPTADRSGPPRYVSLHLVPVHRETGIQHLQDGHVNLVDSGLSRPRQIDVRIERRVLGDTIPGVVIVEPRVSHDIRPSRADLVDAGGTDATPTPTRSCGGPSPACPTLVYRDDTLIAKPPVINVLAELLATSRRYGNPTVLELAE